MKNITITILLFGLTNFSHSQAVEYYEGTATFKNYEQVNFNWMVQLLPYNPIIVEAGAYCGKDTINAKKVWPNSRRIVAFEPNPRAFSLLQQAIEEANCANVQLVNLALNSYNGMATLYLCRGMFGNEPAYEPESSLLPPTKDMEVHYQGPTIQVPCVTLDDWCVQNDIDHIDLLKLELEGAELQVLEASPNILKNVKVLIVQSFFHEARINMVNYFALKDFLTRSHFVPLAHWYDPNSKGAAVYVSEELYDAYFVRCLGLGLGGLSYP